MRTLISVLMLLAASIPARGDDIAGRFDYYVLPLSWSPNWCALEGDARRSPQCDEDTGYGWILHGLWPQYTRGWPQDCDSDFPAPSGSVLSSITDIMPSRALARHQWQKHGTCDGRSPTDYFAAAREAFEGIAKPPSLRQHGATIMISALEIEAAFLEENQTLFPEALTVTCRRGAIQEVRICLNRETLSPRRCTGSVAQDCVLPEALLAPVR